MENEVVEKCNSHTMARLKDRILALLIDWAVLFGFLAFIGLLLSTSTITYVERPALTQDTQLMLPDWRPSIILLFLIFIIISYHLLFETILHGRSPGKCARNLQIVRLDGSTPRFRHIFLRWLFRLALADAGASHVADGAGTEKR